MVQPRSQSSRAARDHSDIGGRLQRYSIGKMAVSPVTMADAIEILAKQIRSRTAAYVCVANLYATLLARKDDEFCRIQNQSLLTVPDGMPLVWYAWLAGVPGVERVTGPDLLMEVLKVSAREGFTHYFYGDTQETLSGMAQVIESRFPGVVIEGMHSPPFRELTNAELHTTIDEINRLKPSFVWVALTCPKQERWMARVLPEIESSVLVGVGAAFRFLTGFYRHPPKLLQLCGLEGAFWRARHHPLYNLWWYAYHTPVCGLLLAKALAHRFRYRRGGPPQSQ
jgi:N-acetylglucosaminyldiphosphoundecaprenol N-acetyl-beta-D-mannosaminyltransferase